MQHAIGVHGFDFWLQYAAIFPCFEPGNYFKNPLRNVLVSLRKTESENVERDSASHTSRLCIKHRAKESKQTTKSI